MPVELPADDEALLEASELYVREGRTPLSVTQPFGVPSTTGQRTYKAVRSVLKGLVSSFSNETVDLSNYDTVENDHYNACFLWDMYQGVQTPYLDKLPSEVPERFEDRPGKMCVNFLSLLLDIKCQLYDDPPLRTFYDPVTDKPVEGDKGLDRALLYYKRGGFDAAMQLVNRYAELHGECLLRPIREGRWYRWAVIPKCDYALLIKPKTSATQQPPTGEIDPMAKNDVAAVALFSRRVTVKNNKHVLIRYVDIWTDKYQAHFEDSELTSLIPNRYGFIPYLHCPKSINFQTRYREPDMLEDALGNSQINNILSLSNYQAIISGLSLTVVSDDFGQEGDFSLVPGNVFKLTSMPAAEGKTATIQFLAPPDRVQSFRMKIEELVSMIFQRHGVNYSFQEGVKAGVSGLSIVVSMAPVLKYLKRMAPVMVDIENRHYDMFRRIAAAEAGEAFPENAELDVDYMPTQTIMSDADLRQDLTFKLQNGLITRKRALMLTNRTRYRSEADAEADLPDEAEMELLNGTNDDPAGGTGTSDADRLKSAAKQQDTNARGKAD